MGWLGFTGVHFGQGPPTLEKFGKRHRHWKAAARQLVSLFLGGCGKSRRPLNFGEWAELGMAPWQVGDVATIVGKGEDSV